MKTIGFTGGSSLCELGAAADVQLFFDCLNFYVASRHPEQDWGLLTDRLYKRYLRLDELDKALDLMEQAKKIFMTLPSESVDWQNEKKVTIKTRLDSSKKTLAEIFEVYFDNFSHCVESAKISYEGFKSYPGYKYESVRIVIATQPCFLIEKNRSLEEYDMLEGEPFWALSGNKNCDSLKEMKVEAALNLKKKLTSSKNPLAKDWLNGSFGEMLDYAISGNLENINDVPHFDFFAHGGFSEVEDEYFAFHSLICFGKSTKENLK